MLSHRAGVPNLPREALDLDRIGDRDLLVRDALRRQAARAPGRLLAYHAISGGFILGEIVQRVTGKDIREVLAEEILDPLGFRWGNYGVAPKTSSASRRLRHRAAALPPVSTLLARALGRAARRGRALSNDPRFLTGDRPGGERCHHRERAVALLRAASRRAASSTACGCSSRARSSARVDRAVATASST